MSDYALDHLSDRTEIDEAAEIAAEERDWIEAFVRKASRFAGYASLTAAVIGIVYIAIR